MRLSSPVVVTLVLARTNGCHLGGHTRFRGTASGPASGHVAIHPPK